jgi:TetR/AcrR family transcriptional repressor of uid operon
MASSAPQIPSAREKTQREKQRNETRERIFEAAVAEFERTGFADAQIPRIAEAAGVVRGTFYFHFPSKEQVLIELAERDHARIASEMHDLRGSGASIFDVLNRLIDSIINIEGPNRNPSLLRDLLAILLRAPPEEVQGEEPRPQPVLEELTHHVGEAIRRGELRQSIEPERLAATVLTSIFGVIVARRGAGPDDRPELELLIDLLLNGMSPER